jgi:hypothetical protein
LQTAAKTQNVGAGALPRLPGVGDDERALAYLEEWPRRRTITSPTPLFLAVITSR